MSNGLTNGKMLKEIFERVVRLDEWSVSMDERITEITEVFKPDGICSKSRNRIESLFSHVKVQWWFIAVIAAGLLGIFVTNLLAH